MSGEPNAPARDFIRDIVAQDGKAGKWGGKVVTRFPPEPNGHLHIGHAKAIWTSYGIAQDFGGTFHLRFDDTNPLKEEQTYVEAIQEEVAWLGCRWDGPVRFASDYFEQMYHYALELIRKGKAYVDDLSVEEIRAYRGSPREPGKNSPYRDRPVEENLDLFERMKAGEFPDGARVLRAKIDMAHVNLNMRDPVMYRILHAVHPHRGDEWCIYPMYDWAHGLEDSIEGVTHSLCDVSFENHRPLYNWFIDAINEGRDEPIHHPRQIEFARYNLTHTAMSKRYLRPLVERGFVRGWDDPRMPTLIGLRRRGYTPEGLRDFSRHTGVSKYPAVFEIALVEHFQRRHLNQIAPRVMGVLRPLKLVIDNYPDGQTEQLDAINNPEDESAGTRKVPFGRVLYIERDDFMEEPPKKFFRLSPGREVRLRYAYFVTCTSVVKNDAGEVTEIHCTYDPATRGGDAPDGRKVKATLHWVSAEHAVEAEVRLYDLLFTKEDPLDVPEGEDWTKGVNPESLTVIPDAKLEPAAAGRAPGWRCQFERLGYFCLDPDSTETKPVFNRTVTLKDAWAKEQKKGTGD
ncbi:MAG: glutamine--tRNA ligase/YqeY domain fusion protein [Phycisphaerae bacterium]|nr:glutamine--tRNA ligase/YqeY domain fusion protein [Phycisphaerae bacterium]